MNALELQPTRKELVFDVTGPSDFTPLSVNPLRVRDFPRVSVSDIAIWDNRCCMHFPHNDYQGQTRAMRRVIVEGERPA